MGQRPENHRKPPAHTSLVSTNIERDLRLLLQKLDANLIQPGDTNGAIVLRFFRTQFRDNNKPVPVVQLIKAGAINTIFSLHQLFDLDAHEPLELSKVSQTSYAVERNYKPSHVSSTISMD